MSNASFSADDIASFLQENPDFFQEHASLFADLKVPHPNQARAISLGERQIMALRNKTKELERLLAQLKYNAGLNENINQTLTTWCADMLAEADPHRLPEHITSSLERLFDLPAVRLYTWAIPALAAHPSSLQAGTAMRTLAATLDRPYCGPPNVSEAADWFDSPPASLALISLRPRTGGSSFGLLALASDESDRFTTDMGTDFLTTIGTLTSAGLSRLLEPSNENGAQPL